MKPRRLALYRDADVLTDQVSRGAGLACPTGCGACCVRTPPHVSVADMAPIARAVIEGGAPERGERAGSMPAGREAAEALHARATAAGPGPCVLFAPAQLPGGCTVYAMRPVICRLFAFAAVRDKRGALELAVCREHTAADPTAPARARAYLDGGGAAPVFADLQLEAHDPDDGPAELMPINDALATALERALLRARYS
jgi:Fe-S-cluster containining protein